MAYNILTDYQNGANVCWPGTESSFTNVGVSFSSDGITLKSASIDSQLANGYRPATIYHPEKQDFTKIKGIQFKYYRTSLSKSIPRFLVILMNKTKPDGITALDACIDRSQARLPAIKEMLDIATQKDPTFGYICYAFKSNTYMADGDNFINTLGFSFNHSYATFNSNRVFEETYTHGTNQYIYYYWTGGQPVDKSNCYLAITLYGCNAGSIAEYTITEISEFNGINFEFDSFIPTPDNGNKYMISDVSLKILGNAIRTKIGSDTTTPLTPQEMVQKIYNLNGRRYEPGSMDILNIGDTFDPSSELETDKVYLFNKDAEDYWCTHNSGGWRIAEGGWGSQKNFLFDIQDDNGIRIGSYLTSTGNSYPTCIISNSLFNLKSIIAAGYKKLRIKTTLNHSAISGFQGYHRFEIFFINQKIDNDVFNIDKYEAFKQYKDYYVELSCINDSIYTMDRSSAYMQLDNVIQDNKNITYITIYFNQGLLNVLNNNDFYLGIGTYKPNDANETINSKNGVGGQWDKIHAIYLTK